MAFDHIYNQLNNVLLHKLTQEQQDMCESAEQQVVDLMMTGEELMRLLIEMNDDHLSSYQNAYPNSANSDINTCNVLKQLADALPNVGKVQHVECFNDNKDENCEL